MKSLEIAIMTIAKIPIIVLNETIKPIFPNNYETLIILNKDYPIFYIGIVLWLIGILINLYKRIKN